MKSNILIVLITALLIACDDDVVVMSETQHQQNEIEEIRNFIFEDENNFIFHLVIGHEEVVASC